MDRVPAASRPVCLCVCFWCELENSALTRVLCLRYCRVIWPGLRADETFSYWRNKLHVGGFQCKRGSHRSDSASSCGSYKINISSHVLSDSFAHYCVCVTVMIFHWTWMLHSYWHLLCSLFTVWHHGCAVGRTFCFLNIFQIFVFSLVFSGVCPEFRKLQCQIKHTQPAGKGQKIGGKMCEWTNSCIRVFTNKHSSSVSFTASSGTHRRAASVEHNPADERDLENLLSQSSNSSNMETNSTLRRSIA